MTHDDVYRQRKTRTSDSTTVLDNVNTHSFSGAQLLAFSGGSSSQQPPPAASACYAADSCDR